MVKQRLHHSRSKEAKLRRSIKERTRRALLSSTHERHTRYYEDSSNIHENYDSPLVPSPLLQPSVDDDCLVDRRSIDLYKWALCSARGEYNSLVKKITDGTAKASAVEWGPVCGQCDVVSDADRDGDSIQKLREVLKTAAISLGRESIIDPLRKWIRLSRDEQGAKSNIWEPLQATIRAHAIKLRAKFRDVIGSNHADPPESTTPIRVGLLRDLSSSTEALSDPDDVELLDQIIDHGGVHIGIDEPINATGKWPLASHSPDMATEEDTLGLSQFALHSWRNYQSADLLSLGVRKYLQKEVADGNMEVMKSLPPGAIISKIAAIEKRPGDVDSPLRIIDDLKRSKVNDQVVSPETLQLPGVATTAFIYAQRKAILREKPCQEQVVIETDCKAAFRHVPICLQERRFCMNYLPEEDGYEQLLVQHCKLPFGLTNSPILWVRICAQANGLRPEAIILLNLFIPYFREISYTSSSPFTTSFLA